MHILYSFALSLACAVGGFGEERQRAAKGLKQPVTASLLVHALCTRFRDSTDTQATLSCREKRIEEPVKKAVTSGDKRGETAVLAS